MTNIGLNQNDNTLLDQISDRKFDHPDNKFTSKTETAQINSVKHLEHAKNSIVDFDDNP